MLLSFIIPVMGRLHHVKQALESVLKQPDSQVILVDWSCPDKTAEWAENTFQEKYPNLKTIRVPNQEHFHLSRARNIGAHRASGEFLCFLDCDMILKEGFAEACLASMDSESFAMFAEDSTSGFGGMIIVTKETFDEIGGYNEEFQGWGYEDTDFKDRVAKIVLKVRIPNNLATHIEHGDGDRVKHYQQKDHRASWRENRQLHFRQNNIVQPQGKDILIPKIFHFIWLGSRKYQKLEENIRSWQANHPDWKFIFWTDQEDLKPEGCEIRNISELFPLKRQDLFNRFSVFSCRTDVLRLEIIRKFGGVYVDCDFLSRKSIDEAIVGLEGFTCYSTEHINNGIFGAKTGSLWVDKMLSFISDSDGHLCGVNTMTKITPSFPNIHVFEDWVFYPVDYYGKSVLLQGNPV